MAVAPKAAHRITFRQWLPALLVVIGLYIILPQLQVFRDSLKYLHGISYLRLALACVATALTFAIGALVYKILAFKKISYARTLVAQLAANFINRLLPAGIGGIGANYRYLRRQQHSAAQAASVVTANNSLGLVGHGVLLLTVIILFHAHAVPVRIGSRAVLISLAATALLVVLLTALPKIRRRLQVNARVFGRQLLGYRQRPVSVSAAVLVQICLTLSNVAAFWLCVLAVHASLTFVAALLIFTFGFGVGAATPTPGGLGGVEAGLLAGLVAYHIASPSALAAVLAYRLISYWLPLLICGPVFIYASKRHYFN